MKTNTKPNPRQTLKKISIATLALAVVLTFALYTATHNTARASMVAIVGSYSELQGVAEEDSIGGDIIMLTADILDGTTTLVIERDLTIDLNGHTLTIEVASGNGININSGVKLTITDSSSAQTGELNVTNTLIGSIIGGGAGIKTTGAELIIQSGTVYATGGNSGAGIGGGWEGGSAGTLAMNGNGVVFASSVQPTGGDRVTTQGILFIGNDATGIFYGTSVTLTDDVTIPTGFALTIPATATLTIPANKKLTNEGEIINEGTIENKGNIANNGTIDNTDGTINSVIGGITGNGKIDGTPPTYPDPPTPTPTPTAPPAGEEQLPNTPPPEKWTGGDDAVWTIEADIEHFQSLLLMPETELELEIDYTIKSGSTVITLLEDYLKTLDNGTYTFRAEFGAAGYAQMTLTVAIGDDPPPPTRTSTTPKTGTPSNIILWAILSVASATTATATIATLVRRDKKTQR